MGRKGKVDTRRKPILQLDENKKSGAKANKKNRRKEESTAKQKYQPLYVDGGAGEVFDPQEQEKVAAEIETFLKEIVEASKQGKESLEGQTPPDEFTLPETMDTAVSSPIPSTMEVPADMATVSFWQAVVDSKTNSSYYWNPATNEVSWTLPPNSVITNEQPVPALTGTGEASGAPVGGSLQDYYAYYSQQIYGVDAGSQVQTTVTEESKDKNAQVAAVSHTANPGTDVTISVANGISTSSPDSPVVSSEAFIGPALATTNRNKGSLPNQDSPTVRGEKRHAEELSSPVGPVADNKKTKVQVKKSPVVGKQKQTGNTSSTTTSSANEQALRFQVSAMADEFMRKLQYLHIGDEGFSPLQVMKIQVETRLEDWKDGGLPSKHLLAKLKEANKLVAEYEISAAPLGWKCVWDSATCRYFYQNTSTGESSWEYPAHSPMSPAHSELSEQPLELTEGSNRSEPVQVDVSMMQDGAVIQVPVTTNSAPTVTTVTLSGQEVQEAIIVHPPPPPTGPPPPPATSSQQKDTTRIPKTITSSSQSEEKALDEVRQKLHRPPRSGGLYSPEDLAAYEEPERPRVQIEASTGMEFISEFPPKQPDVRVTPGERAEKKKGKSSKKQTEDEIDDFSLAPLPMESKPSKDVSGWSAPLAQREPETATSTQREPEAAALVQHEPEPEPLYMLRDSDIEVAQEQVADSTPRKVPELVGNEYGGVAPELPGTAADFPLHQGDGLSNRQQQQQLQWDQGVGDALGNMLPTPPQEVVVVEERAMYGMEDMEGNMGGDDLLQPSDELGYAGSVEVETVEMCVATSPLEQQDITESYGSQVGLMASAVSQFQPAPSAYPQGVDVDVAPPSKSLEESELILRERLLRRVMQQHQSAAPEASTHAPEVGNGSSEVAIADVDDAGGKAPDVAESVELSEYGPEVRLLQSGEDSKYADHSQVGLQLEVSTTVPTRELQQHTPAGREKKDESAKADIEEEGEIVSTPEKRQRQETPPKTSTGKASASKRDLEREDSKSKSSRRVKKHRSRSRSKSKERHSRRTRKHSDVSDSGDDYSRRSSKRGRRRRDDRSDSEDYHHSRRSRKHSDSDGDRSSSRKDRRHSRSVSRDSKDSHDKSQKRKKKDKKDKKKRRSHHSGSKERSGDDADKKKNSTPQNIIVGKVGSLGSIRQLGQEKKAQASTPQPEQTPPGFQSQQTPLQLSQGDAGQGTGGYYPQTSYMYGGYQYPYTSEQSWQGQQGWDQQQQGWQGSTTTSTATTATTTSAAGGEQVWSVGTTTAQQGWEHPCQQSEEVKQQPSDLAPVPVAAEEHVWRWDDQQHQKTDLQPQPSLSQEGESRVVREEQVCLPAQAVPAEVEVVDTVGHVKPGEDQEIVVEEAVIDENSDVIEVPTDAEITECDMEIEQMSSEAFLNEKKARVAATVECEKELPPGAETPPATERDRTPSPLAQEPPAIQYATGSSAGTTTAGVQEQLLMEKPAPESVGDDSSTAPQLRETNSPQINGEQEPRTPPKDSTKQDRSTPGTPTTAEAPPPTSGAVATSTPQAYNYSSYAAPATAPAGYDYSAYSQAGYDYSQAYSAYVQAAAASMAYASYSQYYANPYAAAFAGYGSPYAAYYQYANAGAFQSPGQAAAPQAQQGDSGKKGKKEESKGMIEKWNTLQTQYGKPA